MQKPYQYIPPKPPMWFNLFWPGIFGGFLGFLTATGQKNLMFTYSIIGTLVFILLTYISIKIIKVNSYSSFFCALVLLVNSLFFFWTYLLCNVGINWLVYW